MFSRKLTALCIFLSIIGVSFSSTFVPRAQAFSFSDAFSCLQSDVTGCITSALGQISVPSIDVVGALKTLLNVAATAVAQATVQSIVKSTITWANTGFQGGPAYVTDPQQYFGNIANGVAGTFIKNSKVGFLCSPIQNVSLKISLSQYYTSQYQAQCTLTGVVGNIDNFYDNFNNGGWGAFIQVTQQPQNNPYGSFIQASVQLDNQLANALGVQQQKLNWSQGFKSKGDCLAYNHWPPASLMEQYENGEISDYPSPYNDSNYFNDAYADGDCLKYGPDKTPGSIIKDQLDQVLPSGLQNLISVQDFDQLINATMSGLLQRFVFSPSGLFSSSYSSGLPNPSSKSLIGSATNSGLSPALACYADNQFASVHDQVGYQAVLNNFAGAIDYQWTGTEISNASSYSQALGYATSSSIGMFYLTPGQKTMNVTASTTDITGKHINYGPVSCTPLVNVN